MDRCNRRLINKNTFLVTSNDIFTAFIRFIAPCQFGRHLSIVYAGFAFTLMSWPSTVVSQEVIANKQLPEIQLTRNEARLYFTLRLALWKNDTPVKVFVLPDDHPLHQRFTKSILDLFPYQLRRVWDRQLFSGTGQVPITVTSEQEMIEKVASTPGAIGYSQSGTNNPHIQTLQVH